MSVQTNVELEPSPTGGSSSAIRWRRDWWLVLSMGVSASSAMVSSFSGLRALAEAAGWSPVMASSLPMTVDAYALAATRIWLADSSATPRARQFARWNAMGAIGLSLAGNATYHAIAAGLMKITWVVVVIVGAVPPAVLGLVSHLAALRHQAGLVGLAPVPSTAVLPPDGPRYGSEDELLAAARAADAAHRAAHGKPITRDALRKALHVSGARATEALRRLKIEAAEDAT